MRIRPIVEGDGEVESVPLLLRRLRDESGVFNLQILPPFRRHSSEFADESAIRRIVQLAVVRGCEGLLILFDSDKRCPRVLAPQVQAWATDEAGGIPCEVVMAHCEYEAWFLATLESLRGQRGVRPDAVSYPDPESVRGAKEKLATFMGTGRYASRGDQVALTARFDLAAAYRGCRSFRRMVNAYRLVVEGTGIELTEWPPASWGS